MKIIYLKKIDGSLDDIIIESNDPSFLQQKADVIAKFSEASYPLGEYESAKIEQQCLGENDSSSQPIYWLKLKNLLPIFVWMQLSSHVNSYANKLPCSNCHGAAIATAGILPIFFSADPLQEFWLAGYVNRFSVKSLLPGDILSYDIHSFVYLDEDLCFSANGSGQPLQLCKLTDVLHYNLPIDTQNIVYRKKANINFDNVYVKAIIDTYHLSAVNYSITDLACPDYAVHREKIKYLFKESNTNHKQFIYEKIARRLGVGFIRAAEEEAKNELSASKKLQPALASTTSSSSSLFKSDHTAKKLLTESSDERFKKHGRGTGSRVNIKL